MTDQDRAPGNAFLDIRSGDGVDRRVALAGAAALIGRAVDSQVLLESTTVSRHHAQLTQDASGRWQIRDLGSRNGTLINGHAIKEQLLRPGDQIQIGSFELTFAAHADAPTHPTLPASTGLFLSDELSRLSTLKDLEPPRVAASHLTTLNQLSQALLITPDPRERALKLCQMMTNPQFHGDWAVLLRVTRDTSAEPTPELLCDPQRAATPHALGQMLHVSRSLLRAVARQGEAVLAGNIGSGGGGADVEMSIAPGAMALAAVGCPLQQDDKALDLLYVTLPPQYGTGEWLALASLAAKQYQQAEQSWAARTRDADHAALERELKGAREIQQRLVPKAEALAAFKERGIDVAVGFAPSRWVGGDYVDAMLMKDGRVLLALADVCGHGLAAALVTSAVHTLIHAAVRRGADLLELVDGLNQHLCETLSGDSFVTFIALAVNPADGSMQYANAGHPPPLVVSRSGEVRHLPFGHNPPLGIDAAPIEDRSEQLAPGELLAIYSDGLNEQTDGSGAMLGIPALKEKLRTIAISGASAADALARQLDEFLAQRRGDRPPNDDQSFLLAVRI
jgi:serine phosphatase RsbU (regulator of sigma subunit)